MTTPTVLRGLCLAVLLAVGCASDSAGRKSVHPTRGSVFVQGKPAAGARVTFHPTTDAGLSRGAPPFAVVDADGSFAVTTYLAKDGAPEGEYIVTILWPTPPPPGKSDDDVMATDRLRNAYANPKTSKLRATVKPGMNELESFQLK